MTRFTTSHLKVPAQTVAKVIPNELDSEERRLILEGSLGYCETHGNLYRKMTPERIAESCEESGMINAIERCPAAIVACKCDNPDPSHGIHISEIGPCVEWPKERA